MSEPFLAEIRLMSFGFAPKGWAFCNGQLLPINQNQALFSLLGTTYGGDGRTTFALPNLSGRAPAHAGDGLSLGQSGGEVAHTLTMSEMAQHTHPVGAVKGAAAQTNAVGMLWAESNRNPYANAPNAQMNPASVTPAGGNQAHANLQPYLALNFCIALQGIFPSQN